MVYSGTFQPLNDDSYVPQTPKLHLQQYDNYGIYSIVCISRIGQSNPKLRHFLAWQTQHVRPISVNFRQLAELYPGI